MTIRAKAHLTDESGAMIVEYALLLAVISMAVAINLLGLQPPICRLINNVSQMLGSPASDTACVGAIGAGSGNSGNNGNNGNGNGTGNGKGNNGIGGGNGGGTANGGGPNR